MAQPMEQEVMYYYDRFPTEKDLMGVTSDHDALERYLVQVLQWLFQGQRCAIYANLNIYQTRRAHERPLAPDIVVIKGVAQKSVRSWSLAQGDPAPHVVIEIASRETWDKDLKEKPSKYAHLGVREYFAYDPNHPALRPGEPRLLGWRLNRASGEMEPLLEGPGRRLWSEQLESWLKADGAFMRLYDRSGQLRLTRAEAEAQRAEAEAEAKRAAMQRAEAEAEAKRAAIQRAEEEAQRAETEAEAKRAAIQRAEAEAEAKRAAMQLAEKLAEKLRSLGIDPNQI